jgi:uroporphyrinogen-III synthase
VEVPVVEVVDAADGGAALAAAVDRLAAGAYGWLVLTSPNGARRLLAALRAAGRDARALGGVRLAAIGPGTADVLAAANLVPDLVPPRFVAESLLEAFPDAAGGERPMLLARAAVARDVLPEGLAAKGWRVDVVDAYRTRPAPLDDHRAAALADAEIVTFTSSSTVTNFLATVGRDAVPPVVAAIGPVTAATAREHGLHVDVEAEVHSIDGLVDALCAWAADHPAPASPEEPTT